MRTAFLAVLTLSAFISVEAGAQQAPQPAQSAAPQTQPGGPGPGCCGGKGPGVGPDYTHGWGMMSPAERDSHRQQMSNAKTAGDCRQIRDDHHKQMTERAKSRGVTGTPGPRHDACANFPS